jgi:hypothetical protein
MQAIMLKNPRKVSANACQSDKNQILDPLLIFFITIKKKRGADRGSEFNQIVTLVNIFQ